MPKVSFLIAKPKGKSKSLFHDLKKTKALVLLSIAGNQRCKEDYLGAMVKNSSEHQFTTFLIADEIHWHNLKGENTSKEEELALREEARQLGLTYFEEQLQQFLLPLDLTPQTFEEKYPGKTVTEKIALINELAKDKYEIVVWQDWLKKAPSFYLERQDEIAKLYATEPTLKDAIEEGAVDFLGHAGRNVDDKLSKYRSVGYLSEENFAVMWLSAFLEYNFILYPGVMPKHFGITKALYGQKENTILDKAKLEVFKIKDTTLLANWLNVSFQTKTVTIDEEIKSEPVVEETKPIPVVQEPAIVFQGNVNQFFQPANATAVYTNVANDVLGNLLRVSINTILSNNELEDTQKVIYLDSVLSRFFEEGRAIASQCIPKVF